MEAYDRSELLLQRLKQFALRAVRLYGALPKFTEAQIIGKQLLRSATSPGAQYSEARRAKSNADYLSKVRGALQELEETRYWLDLLAMTEILPAQRLADLYNECDQLIRILSSSIRKASRK